MKDINLTDYKEFLDTKQYRIGSQGREIDNDLIHPKLFNWQKDIVQWACRKGRCAVFLDTGLGKTFIQLEWARLLNENTLIIAPLSVARQTVRESTKIALDIEYVRNQPDSKGIWITNYEMVDNFDFTKFGAVVLDESSILKSIGGKTRKKLTDLCSKVKYRLCCSATPAPNDYIELGNHTEFLGICKQSEMLATFFINANKEHTLQDMDGKTYRRKGSNANGTEWRLKHHAENPFFKWLSSWAITMTKPSDLGYEDDGFILPPLNINPIYVHTEYKPDNQLFFTGLHGITDRVKVRQSTLLPKLSECVKIITRDINLRGDLCHSQTQKKDADTCENITSSIGTHSLKNSVKSENLSVIQNGSGKGKKTKSGIYAIKPKSLQTQKNITRKIKGELLPMENSIGQTIPNLLSLSESRESMALIYENIDDCLNHSMANVPYVESTIKIQNEDLESTTAIIATKLGDYSVPTAISESAHLEIIKTYCKKLLNTLNTPIEKIVVWCGLDIEQKLLADIFGDLCVSVYGSLTPDEKESREELWREGNIPIMLTKPKIFGHGMNWQCCHRMVFFGLNDSWETYYQCIRRQWRYMQTEPVNVYLIIHEAEMEVYHNVLRKDAQAKRLKKNLIYEIKVYEKEELGMEAELRNHYQENTIKGANWTAMLGDACERLKEIPDNSIDLSVYSPPFADLFTYTSSERDLGNCRNWDEFFNHYKFIIREILRVTKQGRLTCVHTSDIPALAQKDGYIGIKDFPGAVIKAYENEGWIFHGRCFVQKNPQAQAIRTHGKALLFVQLRKDSSDSRPALIDQILIFKKEGQSETPVTPVKNGEMDNDTWIEWAHGIWTGIRETQTLQFSRARGVDDEKHICPLQLGTIERCIKLYSNPNEMVLTPFGGIGSEAYMAIKLGRKATLIELKPEYFEVAVKNLRQVETQENDLFSVSR